MINTGELVLKRREARKLFGLAGDLTKTQLRRVYRQLALQYHPDRNLSDREEATNIMVSLNEAYKILLTPETNEEKHIEQFYEGFMI